MDSLNVSTGIKPEEYYQLQYFFISFLIGLFVALSELLSRYKTSYREIFRVPMSYLYFFINGIVSAFVYWIYINLNQSSDGFFNKPVMKAVIAGVSSMMILRSSLLNFRIGEKNVDIGLAAIIQIYLNSAERAFDQKRSENHGIEVKKIMESVNFSTASINLPTLCFNLMQNISYEEQKQIGEKIGELSKDNTSEMTKSYNLGIILCKLTGIRLLEAAVKLLGEEITKASEEKLKSQEILEELKNKLKKS